MKLNLPKSYLSWSAISCWEYSPAQFRKRYYENAPTFISPEMCFGSHVGKLLENADESLAHIKRYATPEQVLKTTIDGVPIFGFIDSFDPDERRIIEYKTSRVGWDMDKVNQHGQLDLYSLCVQEIFGSVHDTVTLIWLETEVCEPKTSGLISHEDSHKVRLTGRVEEFEREVTQADRDAMRERVVNVAQAISDDYSEWLSVNADAVNADAVKNSTSSTDRAST